MALLAVLVVVLLLLVLSCVLATASVVIRMAAHMRDESWSRITSQQRRLRDREEEVRACTVCGNHPSREWEASS